MITKGKEKGMSIKDVKLVTVEEELLEKVKLFNSYLKQIDSLVEKRNAIEVAIIEEFLKDKSVNLNQYYKNGENSKLLFGVAQSNASYTTSKKLMEQKLVELKYNLEDFKVLGNLPKATLKVTDLSESEKK